MDQQFSNKLKITCRSFDKARCSNFCPYHLDKAKDGWLSSNFSPARDRQVQGYKSSSYMEQDPEKPTHHLRSIFLRIRWKLQTPQNACKPQLLGWEKVHRNPPSPFMNLKNSSLENDLDKSLDTSHYHLEPRSWEILHITWFSCKFQRWVED